MQGKCTASVPIVVAGLELSSEGFCSVGVRLVLVNWQRPIHHAGTTHQCFSVPLDICVVADEAYYIL